MKITLIHGQNHKGSTYHIGRMLAEKLGGEITEFFSAERLWGVLCGMHKLLCEGRKLMSSL